MQRKAFVPGVAVLLVTLVAGCTGGGSGDGGTDDANPGGAGTATAAAEPGRYRTLPEPCGSVSRGVLDALLPGLAQIPDEDRRERAYEGDATITFDTDRKVGCRWKASGERATHRLSVDLERIVSYDTAVSDDSQAEELFARKQEDADLPLPSATGGGSGPSGTAPGGEQSGAPAGGAELSLPSDLQPRTLDGLGDEAFLDDALSSSGSTARRRTVTVAFRTSNVIVTVVYEEQSTVPGAVPDSEEMQDRARNLASQLASRLTG